MRRIRAAIVTLLVVAATLSLLLQQSKGPCSHESSAPGIYNAECPLLVAHPHDGSSPSPPLSTWTGGVAGFVPTMAVGSVPAAFVLQLGSRAPPHA